jgi:hypothetical protein
METRRPNFGRKDSEDGLSNPFVRLNRLTKHPKEAASQLAIHPAGELRIHKQVASFTPAVWAEVEEREEASRWRPRRRSLAEAEEREAVSRWRPRRRSLAEAEEREEASRWPPRRRNLVEVAVPEGASR